MMFSRRSRQLEIKHCCEDCGALLAVHFHDSWQQVRTAIQRCGHYVLYPLKSGPDLTAIDDAKRAAKVMLANVCKGRVRRRDALLGPPMRVFQSAAVLLRAVVRVC
jgi:hypothetical protein